jgi:hypothetical protein
VEGKKDIRKSNMSFKDNKNEDQVLIILSVIILTIIIIILFSLDINEDSFLKDSEGNIFLPHLF